VNRDGEPFKVDACGSREDVRPASDHAEPDRPKAWPPDKTENCPSTQVPLAPVSTRRRVGMLPRTVEGGEGHATVEAPSLDGAPLRSATSLAMSPIVWLQQHSDTVIGAALGVILSIPFAFYLSLYAGLVVARAARFEELRYELIRILQSLEWPPGSRTFQLTGGHRPYDIVLISSDLIPLGHKTAAKSVMKIGNKVSDELNRRTNFMTGEQMEERFLDWMAEARTMRPSRWAIINPTPQLYKTVKYPRRAS
jgi:hypothetical protein